MVLGTSCVRRNLLDSQVNVFLDAKSKASSFTEIPAKELILLYLQSALQELCGFLSTYSNIARNLFIASNPKRTHSVPCCNAKISCECPVDIQSTFYYSSVLVFLTCWVAESVKNHQVLQKGTLSHPTHLWKRQESDHWAAPTPATDKLQEIRKHWTPIPLH